MENYTAFAVTPVTPIGAVLVKTAVLVKLRCVYAKVLQAVTPCYTSNGCRCNSVAAFVYMAISHICYTCYTYSLLKYYISICSRGRCVYANAAIMRRSAIESRSVLSRCNRCNRCNSSAKTLIFLEV